MADVIADAPAVSARPADAPAASARPADAATLKQKLRRSQRAQRVRAFLLVFPLLAFVVISFIMPIGEMLFRSVENQIVPDTLPRTVEALEDWDARGDELPPEPVFAALHADLEEAVAARTNTRLGSRLNYELSGASSLFRGAARDVRAIEGPPYREQFIEANARWGDLTVWRTLQIFSGPYTSGYLLNAVDLQLGPDGIEAKPERERLHVRLFMRTLVMSLTITALCALLGYPIAYLLASLPMRTANLLMILVLLPFWTSLLVRTASWKVLLQQQGVINDVLVWTGIIDTANRLTMINNATGTIIAMTHILLPFMILPLYSVMKTIPPSYVRAAKSLGATDWTAFWRVYFPQSVPGLGAGGILVFILAIGYYITPELVGGTSGVFISNRIAFHISSSLNWGLAAALASLLLAVVLVLYWTYDRLVGIDNVKLGG
jgi:putative spermidine/putrescine transport system permease protein